MDEEKEAIVAFALEHPREGYRRLAWMMNDRQVVCASPTAVYEVLKERDLLRRWAQSKSSSSTRRPPPVPKEANERWHTDVMYLWVAGRWYFLVTILDAYSRYVVHFRLVTDLLGKTMTGVLEEALEKAPGAKPTIVTDNGSEFVNRDFKKVLKERGLKRIRTRVRHPQSNGRVERFHRTAREEGLEDPESLAAAVRSMESWVKHYNEERLHAALGYLPPAVYYSQAGEAERRTEERQRRLAEARRRREEINRVRRAQAV